MRGHPTARQGRRAERGQAAVEAALTLPLVVFLILGTLQLFLMLQARIMAQYAVFRATRAGSVSQGDCDRMMDAAVAALLPTFTQTYSPQKLGEAFQARTGGGVGARTWQYRSALDRGFSGDIVWLFREQPLASSVQPSGEDTFDQGGEPQRLEVRMVFWYPLRIPFADWVITRMARAHFGIEAYHAANPLLLTQGDASWQLGTATMEAQVRTAYMNRSGSGQYVFPITATYSMRMMTPPRAEHFARQHCRPVP